MTELLWTPSEERKLNSNMMAFLKGVNRKHKKRLRTYDQLYRWSIENLADFWAAVWEFCEVKASKKYDQVVDDPHKMPGTQWFTGARLNFAENLLRFRDDRIALSFHGEDKVHTTRTYAELHDEVARLAKALRGAGVKVGDRVAGFMPNLPETIVAMLAATSIGAIWSSTSPDFGSKGVLDRFGQIKPRILFCANGYHYNGKQFDSLARVREFLPSLPSVEKVVVVSYTEAHPGLEGLPKAVLYGAFLAKEQNLPLEFAQLPFDHPLYIMYSSGTTGLPKCMVQGAGGILLNHLLELKIHTDLKREDRIFYYTTCGWMMWNWLASSLAMGATLELYDGSPFYPNPAALWKLAQDEQVTIFGTSAKYIDAIENEGVRPGRDFDLKPLKAILSTGSPLSAKSFRYVYREIKADVQLASIAGGTDINGCFFLGNPLSPVYAGEIQARGLGRDVVAFDQHGKPILHDQGELVCRAAIPSMPIRFWEDPAGKKYQAAYFDVYPGLWRHGDFIVITETGGVIMLGRSDATLNPGGVRIGTAEIYRQVDSIKEIADSVVIGQDWDNDVRVILFVKLAPGVELDEALVQKIKKTIRENTTPRHVPAKVLPVKAIPYTINMKKVELAVRNVVHGKPVLNIDALSNPESLGEYKDRPELQS